MGEGVLPEPGADGVRNLGTRTWERRAVCSRRTPGERPVMTAEGIAQTEERRKNIGRFLPATLKSPASTFPGVCHPQLRGPRDQRAGELGGAARGSRGAGWAQTDPGPAGSTVLNPSLHCR